MRTSPKPFLTPEQYLDWDRTAEQKSSPSMAKSSLGEQACSRARCGLGLITARFPASSVRTLFAELRRTPCQIYPGGLCVPAGDAKLSRDITVAMADPI